MEKQSKRKSDSNSKDEQNASTSRHCKTRKIENCQQQDNINQILSRDGPRSSTLTEKLVSMWLSGNKGRDSILTQEVRESKVLRESQQKCAEAEGLLEKLHQKVQNAEACISNLSKSLHAQRKENAGLSEKLNLTHEMVTTITDHINCTIDTLERCGNYNDQLTRLYHDIILRQRTDIVSLKDREKVFSQQASRLRTEAASLKDNLTEIRCIYEEKLKERETKLASVQAECQALREQLSRVVEERKEISRTLSNRENDILEFQKKILEHEVQVKNLSDEVAQISVCLAAVNDENARLKSDLTWQENEKTRLVEELKSAKLKCAEEVSTVKSLNLELEEKIGQEMEQREKLKKRLDETLGIKDELERQIQKLKEDMETEKEEMIKRLTNAEAEKWQTSEESKKTIDEMEKKYQTQTEQYKSLVVEMQTLEASHQSELSRVNVSSSTTISSANADNSRLEKEIELLRREKEEREGALRCIEDLLLKHTNSEVQLKRKLEQYQSEAAALAASAAAAADYKKNQEAENQENIRKISNLEKELLKLQFNQAQTIVQNEQNPQGCTDSAKQGKFPSARKITAASTYQKSILKSTGKPRRVRSSPPSPLLPSNKKITFLDIESASDASPVKLADSSNVISFPNNEDAYSKFAGSGKSPSQQSLRFSQAKSQSLSQVQSAERKFFKSRNK